MRHVDRVAPAPTDAGPPRLAGARCHTDGAEGPRCTCRSGATEAEDPPPADGLKRFEIRMSADAGEARLSSSAFGTLTAKGAEERCFYVDLPAGSIQEVSFASLAAAPREGFTPHLRVAEYGPKGPYWYDILAVDCAGEAGRCDKGAAEAWGAEARGRKRNRIEPCGSATTTKLHWETSGSESRADGGAFHDFDVTFTFEVKKFATQFPPGATECVPK